jgi:hypothetical protein
MTLIKTSFLISAFAIALTSCEHRVTMETTVHPNGQLDKQIFLEVEKKQKKIKESSIHFIDSIYLTEWQLMDSIQLPTYLKPEEDKAYIGYSKHFASTEEANQHLATPNDTLFRVTSSFEKKFRWFFTYITYSDTYHAINRLGLPNTDFFTEEDFRFIDRLPAEGKRMRAADSIYLKVLNDKITDHYGNRAFFEEYYTLLVDLVEHELPGTDWPVKLNARKEGFYQLVVADKDLEDDFVQAFADSLRIPLRLDSFPDYVLAKKKLERKINFISSAYDGKYTHTIHMPWKIVATNADSVAGTCAYWSPPAIKFLLKDYALRVESRKTNYWAIGVTILLMIGVGWLLRRRV